jgi:hypothetical protein
MCLNEGRLRASNSFSGYTASNKSWKDCPFVRSVPTTTSWSLAQRHTVDEMNSLVQDAALYIHNMYALVAAVLVSFSHDQHATPISMSSFLSLGKVITYVWWFLILRRLRLNFRAARCHRTVHILSHHNIKNCRRKEEYWCVRIPTITVAAYAPRFPVTYQQYWNCFHCLTNTLRYFKHWYSLYSSLT